MSGTSATIPFIDDAGEAAVVVVVVVPLFGLAPDQRGELAVDSLRRKDGDWENRRARGKESGRAE